MAVLLRSGIKRKMSSQSNEHSRADWAVGLLDLPPELLEHVIQFVPQHDIIWLACTCKTLFDFICHSPRLLPPDGQIKQGTYTYTLSNARMDIFLRLNPPERVRRNLFNFCVNSYRDSAMLDQICKSFLLEEYVSLINNCHLERAIIKRDLALFQWLLKTWRQGVREKKLQKKALDSMDTLSDQYVRQPDLLDFVVSNAWPYYQNKGYYVEKSLDKVAATAGQLEILQWILSNNPPTFSVETCIVAAAEEGHLHVVTWLLETYKAWHVLDRACMFAVRAGHLHIIEYGLERGLKLNHEYMRHAIMRKSLPTVRWLHSKKCPWGTETYKVAALFDCIDILGYLYSNGCPLVREELSDRDLMDPILRGWLSTLPE